METRRCAEPLWLMVIFLQGNPVPTNFRGYKNMILFVSNELKDDEIRLQLLQTTKHFYDINFGFFQSTVGSVEGLDVGGSLGGVLPMQMVKLINVDEVTRRRKYI